MKRFVKFLGVALLATSMAFVACSKDENGDTSEATTVDKTPSVTFKFDGKTYGKSDVKVNYASVASEEESYVYSFQASGDTTNTYPYVELEMSRPMGSINFTLDYFGIATSYERYEETGDCDWEMLWSSYEFKVTEFDAAANRMNISLSGSLYDLVESQNDSKEPSDCVQKKFSFEAKNIVFGSPDNL